MPEHIMNEFKKKIGKLNMEENMPQLIMKNTE